MKKLMERPPENILFSEAYKEKIYNLLENADDFEWYVFAKHHLQDYCNDVLDNYDLFSELHISALPPNVVFYDIDTDEEVYEENLEDYLIPIVEMWLEPNVTKTKFLNRLDELYQEMFGDLGEEEEFI